MDDHGISNYSCLIKYFILNLFKYLSILDYISLSSIWIRNKAVQRTIGDLLFPKVHIYKTIKDFDTLNMLQIKWRSSQGADGKRDSYTVFWCIEQLSIFSIKGLDEHAFFDVKS